MSFGEGPFIGPSAFYEKDCVFWANTDGAEHLFGTGFIAIKRLRKRVSGCAHFLQSYWVSLPVGRGAPQFYTGTLTSRLLCCIGNGVGCAGLDIGSGK